MSLIQTNKERYRILCNDRNDIPLFMQAWWMDAVCNNKNWDVLFYKKEEKIIAVWVYHYVKKFGFKIILQPQLTQTNGIWIDKPLNISKNELISFENEVLSNLIQQFQKIKFSYYDQNFHTSVTNWLPFFWKGYEQTTRYTYQINDLSNTEKCFQQFSHAKKKQIRKAEKILDIDLLLSAELFYENLQQNLNASGHNVFYSKALFMRLFKECKQRNQGCIITVRDAQKQIHAALFIVWDKNCAYNLISTINPVFRSSGASSLVVWEAIKRMSKETKTFDFEGSMSENIENSFRQFGSIQTPYFRIRKYNSLLFKLLFKLKNGIN